MGVRKLTDAQELNICQEYISGLSGPQLADKYHVSVCPIYNTLKKRNIKCRPPEEISRKYYCNHEFFNVIDTEEKAYWLGFIHADGSLDKNRKNVIVIGLARKDRSQLEEFLLAIDSDYKILDTKNFNKDYNKWRFASIITISSEQMKNALSNHKKKGFVMIPDRFKSHYIRGVFDGDGTISRRKGTFIGNFSIIGTPILIKEIQKYLMKKVCLNKTNLQRKYPSCPVISLQYCGRRQLKRIGDFLYKDATVWMERKRKIFEEINP